MGRYSIVSPVTIVKHPTGNEVFSFDFSQHRAVLENEETLVSITSVAKAIVNGDATDTLTITGQIIDGDAVLARFSGGTDGQTYLITFTIVTSSNSVIIGIGRLVIESGYR